VSKKSKLKQMLERDGYKCCKCGSTESLTKDHIIPKSQGGRDHLANLQTLCLPCNAAKKNTFAVYRKPSPSLRKYLAERGISI